VCQERVRSSRQRTGKRHNVFEGQKSQLDTILLYGTDGKPGSKKIIKSEWTERGQTEAIMYARVQRVDVPK
jgi:hypothetical protein